MMFRRGDLIIISPYKYCMIFIGQEILPERTNVLTKVNIRIPSERNLRDPSRPTTLCCSIFF